MSKHIGGNQSLQEWESPSCPVCSGIGRDPKTLVTCSSCYGSGKDDTGLPIRKPDSPQSVPADTRNLWDRLPERERQEIEASIQAPHCPPTPDAPLSQGEEVVQPLDYSPTQLRSHVNVLMAENASLLAERDKLATDIAELKALVPEAKEELRALRLQRDKLVERVSVLERALEKISAAYNGAAMAEPSLLNNRLAKEMVTYARAALGPQGAGK